jgi:transcriptional regulator with XRE-family HTH domain
MSFGQHLRGLREGTGLSRAELARRAGVPASTLRNWEGDRGMPSIPAGLRLAEMTREVGPSAAARTSTGLPTFTARPTSPRTEFPQAVESRAWKNWSGTARWNLGFTASAFRRSLPRCPRAASRACTRT